MKSWEQETADMLKKINEETENLLHANLTSEEFDKKHDEITAFWHEISKKIRTHHPFNNKPKARPKSHHQTHHMTEKYYLDKLIKKL